MVATLAGDAIDDDMAILAGMKVLVGGVVMPVMVQQRHELGSKHGLDGDQRHPGRKCIANSLSEIHVAREEYPGKVSPHFPQQPN